MCYRLVHYWAKLNWFSVAKIKTSPLSFWPKMAILALTTNLSGNSSSAVVLKLLEMESPRRIYPEIFRFFVFLAGRPLNSLQNGQHCPRGSRNMKFASLLLNCYRTTSFHIRISYKKMSRFRQFFSRCCYDCVGWWHAAWLWSFLLRIMGPTIMRPAIKCDSCQNLPVLGFLGYCYSNWDWRLTWIVYFRT